MRKLLLDTFFSQNQIITFMNCIIRSLNLIYYMNSLGLLVALTDEIATGFIDTRTFGLIYNSLYNLGANTHTPLISIVTIKLRNINSLYLHTAISSRPV